MPKQSKKEAAAAQHQQEIEKGLRQAADASVDAVFAQYKTSSQGLSVAEIDDHIAQCGQNVIDTGRKVTIAVQLAEAFLNPFNIVLIVVGIITFMTDVVFVVDDKPDYSTSLVILFTVILSSAISFVQTSKSASAASKLKKLVANRVKVVRNGTPQTDRSERIVPGDVVQFSSGDMVAADVRFIETQDLRIDQSALTGESQPVTKKAEGEPGAAITDLPNIGFMGSNVISGTGTGVVVATGNNTYMGGVAEAMAALDPMNSFEKSLYSISKLLMKSTALFVPLILISNIVVGKGFWRSIVFAISTAVGLTPEMLPVIVTSTLAVGAIAMSKRKTIVKDMSSIQSFGQMDVLCTDKTGTLTQDHIVVQKYLDTEGHDDSTVLGLAYLNSTFQTGIKNLIDEAVITRAKSERIEATKHSYVLKAEVPFDFSRRRMSVTLEERAG